MNRKAGRQTIRRTRHPSSCAVIRLLLVEGSFACSRPTGSLLQGLGVFFAPLSLFFIISSTFGNNRVPWRDPYRTGYSLRGCWQARAVPDEKSLAVYRMLTRKGSRATNTSRWTSHPSSTGSGSQPRYAAAGGGTWSSSNSESQVRPTMIHAWRCRVSSTHSRRGHLPFYHFYENAYLHPFGAGFQSWGQSSSGSSVSRRPLRFPGRGN